MATTRIKRQTEIQIKNRKEIEKKENESNERTICFLCELIKNFSGKKRKLRPFSTMCLCSFGTDFLYIYYVCLLLPTEPNYLKFELGISFFFFRFMNFLTNFPHKNCFFFFRFAFLLFSVLSNDTHLNHSHGYKAHKIFFFLFFPFAKQEEEDDEEKKIYFPYAKHVAQPINTLFCPFHLFSFIRLLRILPFATFLPDCLMLFLNFRHFHLCFSLSTRFLKFFLLSLLYWIEFGSGFRSQTIINDNRFVHLILNG